VKSQALVHAAAQICPAAVFVAPPFFPDPFVDAKAYSACRCLAGAFVGGGAGVTALRSAGTRYERTGVLCYRGEETCRFGPFQTLRKCLLGSSAGDHCLHAVTLRRKYRIKLK
jgi:hypothetical protein